jgi:hypothetical protein
MLFLKRGNCKTHLLHPSTPQGAFLGCLSSEAETNREVLQLPQKKGIFLQEVLLKFERKFSDWEFAI